VVSGALRRLAAACLLLVAASASAAACVAEDFETHVSGASECLLMRRYGPAEAATMIVWLHGNVSGGGPANAHFAIARKAAEDFDNVLALPLVRPGYPDGAGESSSGSDNGRADNWQRATIAEIGTAIERLKSHYRPRSLVLVGHSGGAAIAAVLLGMLPQLADAALLIACPCDLVAWRGGRPGPVWTSESPQRWIGPVSARTKVIALTGSRDATTAPELGRAYVERLRARGIDAAFELAPGMGHIDVLRSEAVMRAIRELLP